MIAMLRRRLMSNMAKAKNIATGTATGQGTTLSITGVGFEANHIAVLIQNDGSWFAIQTVFDGHMTYYGSNNTFKTTTASIAYSADGITISVPDIVLAPSFQGTYQWVAWQE